MGKWQVGLFAYHPALLSIWHLQMSFGGALVFCAYLVFDTWRISEQMEVDDYIEGAIQLYMDIVPWPHPASTIHHFLGLKRGERVKVMKPVRDVKLPRKVTWHVLCKEKFGGFEVIFPLKWLFFGGIF